MDETTGKRRDVRSYALALTLVLVVGGGFFLDRWNRSTANSAAGGMDRAAHVQQKRQAEIDARFRQGVMMLHARQYEHAFTAFHRVLELAPEMPEAHVNIGFALLGQKRYKDALDFFDGATTLRPDQLNAYYGMAEAYEGLGDYRGAVESMEAWLHRAKPDDPYRRKAEAAVWEWRDKLKQPAPPAPSKKK
ncbi:MAG TPA: tetratricopeptide repeat protein [Rhodocyclaceae bacterium]|nr:tetratricopeptide repeat protein [Rhodocyclaceae bacterium]